ncbi:MAG: glycosyltransferase [Planctomycetota bacterium]|jgi:GT2 family glycosyltransferase
MPRARVILATYNQVPFLRFVVRGYLRQTNKDFTLVFADDGSGPEQREYLQEWIPKLEAAGIAAEHVWHEDDGWRKNRIMNDAVRCAGDERLLIFSDGDCIPPARFVERHLAVYEPRSFHVGGPVRWSQEITERLTEADVDSGAFESLDESSSQKWLQKFKRKSQWGLLLRRKNRPKVIGLNMAVDRQLFEAVNGFDENFRWPFQGEDTDLRDRLMRLRPRPRVKVLYTRNDVFHMWHPTKSVGRRDNSAYYKTQRPIRCENGLVSA